jgi:hypothetical protein
MSESCQKVFKKLSKSCQKVIKKVVKKLSKVVKKLSKSCQCFLCISIHDISGFRRLAFNDVGREGGEGLSAEGKKHLQILGQNSD